MRNCKLKLNDNKTEMTIILRSNLSFQVDDFGSTVLNGCDLVPAVPIKNIGIKFDKSLNFKQHINMLVKSYNYQMRNICAIRKFSNMDSVVTHSFLSLAKS